MRIHENTMRKRSQASLFFERDSDGKSKFLKKMHVRKPYESSSRIRIGEGAPKKDARTIGHTLQVKPQKI